MGSLQNLQIDQSYPGLIKTNDEAAIGATEKVLQDGSGNNSTLSLGTASASFTGTLDLSGATVTGLPAGAAGLESGSGADSMQSAASLTTVGADASGADSIALGDNSQATGGSSIAIGNGAQVTGLYEGIAIGQNAQSPSNGTAVGPGATTVGNQGNAFGKAALAHDQALAAGRQTTATGTSATSVGDDCDATGARSIAIGRLTQSTNADSIAIGTSAQSTTGSSIAIGNDAIASGGLNDGCIAIGKNVDALQNRSIVIAPNNGSVNSTGGIVVGSASIVGANADRHIALGTGINVSNADDAISIGTGANAGADDSIAIGFGAAATAIDAVALGLNVTAATTGTVSVKALETQTNSTPTAGGIIMSDAGGTDRRLNITATGDLQIDSTPVGGGGGGDTNVYGLAGGNGMAGYTIYNQAAQANHYKTWVQTTGYGRSATSSGANEADYAIIGLAEGDTISKIAVNVFTAAAGATAEVAIYDLAQTTDGGLILYNKLQSLGTIDASTTGDKVITLGTPFTMPAGKLNGQIAFVVFKSDSAVQMSGWTQGIWNGAGGQLVSGTMYRPMALHVDPGVTVGTTLPALIGTGGTYSAETSNPLFFLYKN